MGTTRPSSSARSAARVAARSWPSRRTGMHFEHAADRPERPVVEILPGDQEAEHPPTRRLEQHRVDGTGVVGDQDRPAMLGQGGHPLRLEAIPEGADRCVDAPKQLKQPANLRIVPPPGHQHPGPDQERDREHEQGPDAHLGNHPPAGREIEATTIDHPPSWLTAAAAVKRLAHECGPGPRSDREAASFLPRRTTAISRRDVARPHRRCRRIQKGPHRDQTPEGDRRRLGDRSQDLLITIEQLAPHR